MGVKILFLSLAFQAFSVISSDGYTVQYPVSSPATPTPVRLVNGYDRYSGRVEVYYRGQWGTICDDSFDRNELHVICRMLGMDFGFSRGVVYDRAYFGQGSGPITIDDLYCIGNEHDIAQCQASTWLAHDCSHVEDAGVDCRGTRRHGYSTQQATDVVTTQPPVSVTPRRGVRLVNGYSTYGRVEIYRNGEWMTVCENTLSHNDVRVICRELGYYYGSQYGRIYGSGTYGSGSSYHIVHSLNCGGYESHISQCSIQSSTRNSRCYHYQDAGIDCGAYYIEHTTVRQYPTSVAPNSVRLVNGNGRYSGRVEIYHNGQWMNVCYRYLSQDDVRVICRQLGYFRGYEYGSIKGTGYYGQGSSYYIIDGLSCNGNENSLSQCSSVRYHSQGYYCSHTNDAGIDCYEYNPEPTTEAYYDGQVRLVGGASYAGRVEVYHNHQWMTVCSNTLDENDIKTICRSLGYYYGDSRGSKEYYSQGSTYNIIHYLGCYGYESSLSSCGIRYSYENHYCSHSHDAGINCYGYYSETTTSNPYWHIQTTAGSVLEDAILVSCNENGWDITINMYKLRQQYPTARADEIYLGENSCVGNDNGYDVHFTQGLRQCLTSQMIRNDVLVYRNQLIYAERDRLHPFLIRNYNWTVDVECDVMRNETSKGHLHHNNGGSSNHQISGTSHYSVNMTFYSDPNFRYQLYGSPLSVNVGDKVYVKVFTPNSDWTIKMKVHTCYTKPNDAASGYQKYFIIKNGCEVDGNTHIISQSSHETRFVFQDFEYTSNHEGIYIYCDATFCPSSDYSTSCRQTCNPVVRRRRLPDVMPDTKETSDKGDVDGEKVTEDPFVTTEATSNDEWTELP